jgi:hypothetical protein
LPPLQLTLSSTTGEFISHNIFEAFCDVSLNKTSQKIQNLTVLLDSDDDGSKLIVAEPGVFKFINGDIIFQDPNKYIQIGEDNDTKMHYFEIPHISLRINDNGIKIQIDRDEYNKYKLPNNGFEIPMEDYLMILIKKNSQNHTYNHLICVEESNYDVLYDR